MIEFEVYFNDLDEEAMERLCKTFKTSPDKENWETSPLFILEREDEEEED